MRLLLDTNVVLDVMLNRQPHVVDSAKVMAAVEVGQIEGTLCATTVTTIHYLTTRALDSRSATMEITRLLSIFRIAPVTEAVLSAALHVRSPDYEDAVLFEAARAAGMDGIITRNPVDFPRSSLAVYLPADIVAMLDK